MYSIEEIKELLAAFDDSKATAIDIQLSENEFISLRQRRTVKETAVCTTVQAEPVQVTTVFDDDRGTVADKVPEMIQDGTPVESPMVGVFYAAPSPDSEPYVTVGSKVSKGDVLCLIEAMKLMNEVTAEKSGEITAVCAENGQVVEYGQPLFMIK